MPKKLPKRNGGPKDFVHDSPITEMGMQQVRASVLSLVHDSPITEMGMQQVRASVLSLTANAVDCFTRKRAGLADMRPARSQVRSRQRRARLCI